MASLLPWSGGPIGRLERGAAMHPGAGCVALSVVELADLPEPAERGRQSLVEADGAVAQPLVALRILALALLQARPRPLVRLRSLELASGRPRPRRFLADRHQGRSERLGQLRVVGRLDVDDLVV